MILYWDMYEKYRNFLANREERNFFFITIDDLVCKNEEVLCDDSTLLNLEHNRFDGLHYIEEVKMDLVDKILKRVLKLLGQLD